ncbi:hypothetical protein [Cytobacillus dafuensis]|uniref:Lipoprotein n=1 Tax=Cytobacillus dafuensis TaxID=1742359 RepID=A0A5B8Z1J0_CYTDA|nr:hypothetical protein [Cytobacillus dafuensis]QED46103.1 hypothetical protein FSZ17_01630 [Cytobacillus dafuensis]
MRKAALFFVTIVLFLTSCQKISDASVITLKQVLTSFEEQQLSLKEIEVSKDNIFGMKLNGVRPYSYELEGKSLFVYIYKSTKEREQGLEDFRHKTANANIVSFSNYEVKNVLIFYVYEKDLDFEVDNKIQNVVSKFNES